VFHDDSTLRLCGQEHIIEKTDFKTLANLKIRGEHKIPTLNEYLRICKAGKKNAVIELKNKMTPETIKNLVAEVEQAGWLPDTTFISFNAKNCLFLRELLPEQPVQYITINDLEQTSDDPREITWETLAEKNIGLDIEFTCLSKDMIEQCRERGIAINCWTLNDDNREMAKHFENCGIDFVTSNNLDAELKKEQVREL